MKRFQTKKSLDEVIRIKNLVPGTLVYKGEVKTEFSVNVTLYAMDDIKTDSFKTVEHLIRWISEQNTAGKVLWINVFNSIKKRIINAMGIIRNQSAYYLF